MKKVLTVFIAIAIFIGIAVYVTNDDIGQTNTYEKETRERLENNADLYPVYDRLYGDEKEAYVKICAAFENFREGTSYIYNTDSLTELDNFKKSVNKIYREIVYEQAEAFWVDPYNFEFQTWEQAGKYKLRIMPKYLLEKEEALEKQETFNQKIDSIVAQAKSKNGTYNKVLFVHDYILENADYDYELIEKEDYSNTGINAYGCLVDGKTICSGYTMAFNAIMKRLGYECGAEFSSYSMISLSDEHVWNYCNLDGEYYCFDLTWDEISEESNVSKYIDYYHSYFAITTKELEAARKTLDNDSPAPISSGTQYNYFVQNNINFSTYDHNAVKSALLMQSGKEYAAVRFDSYEEAIKAKIDLIDDGKIFEIFSQHDSVDYLISESGLQLYFFFP